jgi:hypothetical protein
MPTAVTDRLWFPPAALIALGAIALAGNFVLASVGAPCAACAAERIPYFIALPIAAATLLAALSGASDMTVRRFLIIAGPIFLVVAYLALIRPGFDCAAPGVSAETCAATSSRNLWLTVWNIALPLALMGLAMWGAFRPDKHDNPSA